MKLNQDFLRDFERWDPSVDAVVRARQNELDLAFTVELLMQQPTKIAAFFTDCYGHIRSQYLIRQKLEGLSYTKQNHLRSPLPINPAHQPSLSVNFGFTAASRQRLEVFLTSKQTQSWEKVIQILFYLIIVFCRLNLRTAEKFNLHFLSKKVLNSVQRELAETNQADIADMDCRKRLALELFLTQNRIYK